MGGRKQRRPVRTKPLPSIPKIFDCPRCEATAIRISMESDIAVIECGNCHLKQTVTEIKAIEEPIDIYGNFLDIYYSQLESSGFEESVELDQQSKNQQTEIEQETVSDESSMETTNDDQPEVIEEPEVEEEEEEEIVEEQQPTGFVPRSKGDVLKKKQKPKVKKKKIIL